MTDPPGGASAEAIQREKMRAFSAQATRRADAAGHATAEDEILRALLAGDLESHARAARIRAATALLDHDYLAYWVDALELRDAWRALG